MNRTASLPQSRRRRRLVWGLGAAGVAGLGGVACAMLEPVVEHRGEHLPRAQPLAAPPRVAWVFSSGGPRAFVHVGVLKGLEALQLQPDLLVGASAGAWIGVLCAAGLSAQRIEAIALELQPQQMLRLAFGAEERFSGSGIAAMARQQAGTDRLETLRRPVVCVVQRLSDSAVLGFNHGDLGLAVQAATAIEGTIAPVRMNGERYADADHVMPLPVRLARAVGAQRVLAVDASAHEQLAPPGAESWRAGDLHKRARTQTDAVLANLVLHPNTGYYAGLSREYRAHCIAVGERAVLAQAEALRALHA